MFDLKLYSSNGIEIELASCVSYIGYISANVITKKEEEERGMESKKKKGQRKGEGEKREKKWGMCSYTQHMAGDAPRHAV